MGVCIEISRYGTIFFKVSPVWMGVGGCSSLFSMGGGKTLCEGGIVVDKELNISSHNCHTSGKWCSKLKESE